MDSLTRVFEVDASPRRAFDIWTTRASLWWPPGHTISGDDLSRVVFESGLGGRIYELDRNGERHDWGEVVVWEPPNRVVYTWHLFFDPDEATRVEVTFEATGEMTRVQIHQSGFERLGPKGVERRDRTFGAWGVLIPLYQELTAPTAR